MSVLTDNEIAICIAHANWGPGKTSRDAVTFLDVAIAVCRAESGGDPNSDNPGSTAKGLWQILLSAHPEVDAKRVHDPVYNTQMAKAIYDGAHGWTPWVGYTSGAYRSHLGHGQAAYNWLRTASSAQGTAALKSAQSKGTSQTVILDGSSVQNASYLNPLTPLGPAGGMLGDLLGLPGIGPGITNGQGGGIGSGLGSLLNPSDWFTKIYNGMKTVGVFILALVIGILGLIFILKDTGPGKAVTAKAKSVGKDAAMAAVLA